MAEKACSGCAQIDGDPRHNVGLASWHMDCHVLVTDCEVCASQLEACGTSPTSGGVAGAQLRTRLIALRDNNTQED